MNEASGPVLVCFAVEEEARPFRAWAVARNHITVLVSGMGGRNATRGICEALALGKYRLVLTCGFAGGLDPALKAGEVVFSADAPGAVAEALRSAGARPTRFHCTERVVTTALAKQELWRQTGAEAIEMESGVICGICRQGGIASATVRVILDCADEDLPLDFNVLLNQDLQIVYSRLALLLARHPSKIAALIRLRGQTKNAARQLARVLSSALGLLVAQDR